MTAAYDVVVIGEGLAGRMAAIAAAEEAGAVALVSGAESTLRSSTGLIDVLGYVPGRDGPKPTPFDHLEDLPDDHPYRLVGRSALDAGLELFDAVVGDAYAGGHTARNALLPTQLGTVNPAARYPASFEAGLLSRGGDMLLVGFESMPGIDGSFAARSLARRDLPFEVRGANIDMLDSVSVEQPRLRMARALDENERWPEGQTRSRDQLVEHITSLHEGEARIGLPAVLGRRRTDEIMETIAAETGVSIFEYPTTPPSLPGIRLGDRLGDSVRASGVEWRQGSTVGGFNGIDGVITNLTVDGSGELIEANEFVVATGGLVSGGLMDSGGATVEPIFELPVSTGTSTAGNRDSDPFGSQSVVRAGLRTDAVLRPVEESELSNGTESERSEPAFTNLRACGSILGGFDGESEHSAGGVAIATGVHAGREAGREASK